MTHHVDEPTDAWLVFNLHEISSCLVSVLFVILVAKTTIQTPGVRILLNLVHTVVQCEFTVLRIRPTHFGSNLVKLLLFI